MTHDLIGARIEATAGARYTYLGDRKTAPALIGMQCDPVRRPDGKCVVSPPTKDGVALALVIDASGAKHVVLRRRLKLNR